MTLFTKKPMQVEMIRFDGANLSEIVSWGDDLCAENAAIRTVKAFVGADGNLRLWVEKGQSECTLDAGDWIALEGDRDGYYPIESAVHERTYAQYNDDDQAREDAEWLRSALRGEPIPAKAAIRLCLWILKHTEPL